MQHFDPMGRRGTMVGDTLSQAIDDRHSRITPDMSPMARGTKVVLFLALALCVLPSSGWAQQRITTTPVWMVREAQIAQTEQKLLELKGLEQDFRTTLDRMEGNRQEASQNMAMAKGAVITKAYKELGLALCKVGKAFFDDKLSKFCDQAASVVQVGVDYYSCFTNNPLYKDADRCTDAVLGTGITGGKLAKEKDPAFIHLEWTTKKAALQREMMSAKPDHSKMFKLSCELFDLGLAAGDKTFKEKYKDKLAAACNAGAAVAKTVELYKVYNNLAQEELQLDHLLQANIVQSSARLDRIVERRVALEGELAELRRYNATLKNDGEAGCDPRPVVNPEFGRSDEGAPKPCEAKGAKKDTVCDEELGCPDDESGAKGPGKELLAKLGSDLDRIENSQAGTAGGALPGERLEAGSSFDKTAMLRSLRSGLGAYRQGRDAVSSSGQSDGGFSGGSCPNRVPVPQELRAIAQRRGVSVPPDPTIDEMIAQAGSVEAASSGLRQHIQELQQSLAQWPSGRQDDTRRQMELEVGYEQSLLQAVEACRQGSRSAQKVIPPLLNNAPNFSDVQKYYDQNRPKTYKGNPYQCEGPGC